MRLRELREKTDASQKEIADYLGVSRQAYNNYELGNRQPNHETCIKLADYFDVTVDYLLGRDDAPRKNLNKDEKEIEKIVEATIEKLTNTDGLMFDGEVPATEEDIEQLKALMRIGVAAAKERAKEKFTPKKYRK